MTTSTKRTRTHRAGGLLAAALAIAAVGLSAGCDPVVPMCDGRPATIVGTSGADTLTGTAGPDVIVGLAGNDTIDALGGNDAVCAGLGVDDVDGGDDADLIDGSRDTDRLEGGAGSDTLSYARHPWAVVVQLDRGDGGDLDVVSGFEDVIGSPFDDFLIGDHLENRIVGGAGTDTLTGQAGNDQLIDGGSSDPDEENWFFGGPGNDIYYGGRSWDIASFRNSSAASLWINLGSGLAFGEGDDLLSGIDHVIGTDGPDRLTGDERRNVLAGLGGDDVITPAGGDDDVWGGEGRDQVSWFGAPGPITADLAAGTATGQGTDRLSEVEDLGGGNGNDSLTGDAGPNIIDGSNGSDSCVGGGGLDTFFRCP